MNRVYTAGDYACKAMHGSLLSCRCSAYEVLERVGYAGRGVALDGGWRIEALHKGRKTSNFRLELPVNQRENEHQNSNQLLFYENGFFEVNRPSYQNGVFCLRVCI